MAGLQLNGGGWVVVLLNSLMFSWLIMELSQVNFSHYHPVWASLACDYLSIMSSSVSSEHAFLQGGITITKHWNWLKGDIVKALKGVKCAIRHDLLFQEPAPSSTLEVELNPGEDEDGNDSGEGSEGPEGWNDMLMEDENDDSGMDTESDLD